MNKNKNQNQLKIYALGAVIVLFPIIPWMLLAPLSVRFETAATALTSVGQLSALLGTVLFSVVVSMRTSLFSRLFATTSRHSLRKIRQRGELLALILLMSHPVLLATKLASVSYTASVQFFIPGSEWAFNFGIYALLLMGTYYLTQFFAGEEKLKIAPQVLSAILFLGTLHAFFVPSSFSESFVIKSYVLSFVVLAVAVTALEASGFKLKSKVNAVREI